MSKLVHGIGINDKKYPAEVNNNPQKVYNIWQRMLERCTEKGWIKRPTYVGTTCSENFKSYSFFYEWCNKQVGFGNKDERGKSWQLDKDILFKGNKLYSEDTCVFVPHRINCMLTKGDSARGEYPIGVRWHENGKRFHARCCYRVGGKHKHLGLFNTPQEAFQAYKTFKESLIKEVAAEYKEVIDTRVYEALIKYEVNIDD